MKRKQNKQEHPTPKFEDDVFIRQFHLDPAERLKTVQQFDRLYHKFAWDVYKRLPFQIKLWVEVDDLYQEAYMEALRLYELWKPKEDGGTLFSTFVYRGVLNHLNSLVKSWTYQKRFPSVVVELEVLDWEGMGTAPESRDAFVLAFEGV